MNNWILIIHLAVGNFEPTLWDKFWAVSAASGPLGSSRGSLDGRVIILIQEWLTARQAQLLCKGRAGVPAQHDCQCDSSSSLSHSWINWTKPQPNLALTGTKFSEPLFLEFSSTEYFSWYLALFSGVGGSLRTKDDIRHIQDRPPVRLGRQQVGATRSRSIVSCLISELKIRMYTIFCIVYIV